MKEINVGAGQKAVSDENLVVKTNTNQGQAFTSVGDIQE